ncbi:putative FRE ferric reductase-like transmembrane component [Polychaeton citri CBS 116435]|uniref:ferric-chelate reductase (NADPH) n=1 Tax=Polychaeton citri CBS 116435 TaxID=1314669 RepID=A0A9P4PZJ1_9PEZI|nr:putative FRE ferric reductase-like transmembrane component [Polychaeton citri CBS 116435]
MSNDGMGLAVRHIQDHNEANTTLQPHWGYASRVLPCTNDKGTCEYLDAVYWMHDTSMLYSFILWGVILGILVLWPVIRGWRMGGPAQRVGGPLDALIDHIGTFTRRWLLPDAKMFRWIFGRVTRLQVTVLAVILAYLLIFSQVGIVYRTWITPVKHSTLHNTRTGLGGWSDRIGVLAYALTPLAVLLGSRESILSILTGIPYQHFNFLHRWLGRIIFVQSILHTIGWTIVEARLYQPQPSVYNEFIAQQYIIFGVVAMALISFLLVFSLKPVIAWTGYEFFKWTHLIVALLYVGACWGHWKQLDCWMIPSLVLMLLDQAVRYLRMLALHVKGGKRAGIGFCPAQARVEVLGEGDDIVVRIDFDYSHAAWEAGQHFFLCFPSLSIWQSHPFTPSSLPDPTSNVQHHTYLIRVRNGQTSQLAGLAKNPSVPVVLTGPYGTALPRFETRNILAVSGGTGVTFTLPIALSALRQQWIAPIVVDFVWIVRHGEDFMWLQKELGLLKAMLRKAPNLRVSLFITREATEEGPADNPSFAYRDEKYTTRASDSVSGTSAADDLLVEGPGYSIQYLGNHHPCISDIVTAFLDRQSASGGSMEVVGSGPAAMGSDLRDAVAGVPETEGLSFYWDSRE